MKQETLEKARHLQSYIDNANDLLQSKKARYGYLLIKVSCANSNMYDDYSGRVDKETWDKMLAVLFEERDKLKRKLAALSDDSEEDAEAEITSAPVQNDETTEQSPSAACNSKPDRLVWCMMALYCWMLFCLAYWVAGFSDWVTAVSNTLFTAFFIYLVDTERRRQNVKKKED